MASGPFVMANLPRLNYFNATNLLGAAAANFRMALVTNSWVPNLATDELWAVASGNEIAAGGGYATGGLAPPNVTLTQTGGVVKFTSDPIVWNATGAGIAAWRYGVIYYLGTLNGKLNPLVAYFLGNNAPADVPITTNTNSLTITPNAAGIIVAS